MRNLLKFVVSNSIVFLFVLLQGICFILLFYNNSFHKTTIVNSTNSVTGWFLEVRTNVTDYFYLKDANDELAEENAELRAQLSNAFLKTSDSTFTVIDSTLAQKYVYMPAKVIKASTNKKMNTITIDKGSKAGVRKDMGIISPSGIVGKVKDVGTHYATVIPVIDTRFGTGAKIKRTNDYGILTWDADDPDIAILNDISNNVALTIGDTIVSTEFSGIFPDGILVGVLDDYHTQKGNDSHTIMVKLATNFRNIHHVYVVKDLFKIEQDALEKLGDENNE